MMAQVYVAGTGVWKISSVACGFSSIKIDYLKSLISRKMKFFPIKYRYSDILLKKQHKPHLSRLFCCNHTCYCVKMISVTSASRYHPRYQSRSSMYISGLIPWNFAELAEVVAID